MWLFSVLIPLLGLFQLGAAQQACVIDLAMIVDVSGSIMDTSPDDAPITNWGLVLNFMTSVVNSLDNVGIDGTRIAIATFGNRARVEFDFNDYTTKAEILDHTSRVNYAGGNTNTTGGLRTARQSFFVPEGGERPNVADVILLITDGIPTREVTELPAEVQRLKDMNIRILALGVTDSVDEDQLLDIVTNRQTDYFGVDNFDDLESIMESIVTETCRDVTTLPPPVSDCENEADVYLLLDGSGSINENNFGIMKQFASNLVSDLSIDNDQVRMGLALFSDNVDNQFGLTTFSTRSEMQSAIDAMNYPRGRTNTGDAIRYIRETGFNNGDRDNIPNILIIFTDGSSNDQQLTLEQADLARRSGIHIIAVGVGDWTNVYELKSIASFPYDKNYIAVNRFTDLDDALKTMLKNLICNNFDECSPNPCVRGTCVNGIDMYHCICPSGWAGINCDRTCRVGNDIVFAIDSSGSVGKDNFLRELDFVRSVAYGLNMQDSRVGALQYSNSPNVEFHLNTYGGDKMGVMNGLSMYYMDGTTNTASAISTMRNSMFTSGNGDRTNNNVGVVITDGRSNDFDQTWQAAIDARDRGIDMVAVGIGNNLREKELQAIASYPNGPNVIRASNFQDLPSITEDLLDAICNDVNECSNDPCENQGECGDVMNGYQCFCREGYSGVNCERECDNEYDIIFVIDGSGSIRRERFPLVMEFAVSVVEAFEISPSRARFGAVVFSDNAAVEFQLNSFDRKQDIISALRNIAFIGGRTNIAEALELASNQMFTSGNGDRTGAQNHVILLTDGASNIREGQAVPMAVSMRVDGVKISALGIGEGANTLELRGMASSPLDKMMMMAESFNNLRDNVNMRNQMVANVISSTCDEINRCANNPCQNGDCFDDLHQYICDCDLGWVGQECNISCDNQLMDVVLLLDFSGSLDTVFNIVIAFAKEIVHRLPVDRARVGVISFSDDAIINFDLDDHLQKEAILNALSFSRNGGKTNTEEALTVMYSDLFATNRGDRSGVDNKGILVTDGGSNMNREQTLNRARDARDRGIEMFVAAIGDNPDMAEVNGIASDPDSSHVVRIRDSGEVESAAGTLASRLCQ